VTTLILLLLAQGVFWQPPRGLVIPSAYSTATPPPEVIGLAVEDCRPTATDWCGILAQTDNKTELELLVQ
jgi:hypothetical protein